MAKKSKKRNAEKTPAVLRSTLNATREQVAKLHAELVVKRPEASLYHEVMSCLQKLSMDHTCTELSKTGCFHCAAKVKLIQLLAAYNGRRTQMATGAWL